MEHAEAHERLADLALEPHVLASLEGDPSTEATELRAHLERCPTCRTEFDGWRRTQAAIRSALEEPDPNDPSSLESWVDSGPLRAPGSLRTEVAEVPRRERSSRSLSTVGSPAGDAGAAARGSTRWLRGLAALATAAAIVLAVGVGFVASDQARQADIGRQETGELAELATWTSRILSDPDHVSFALVGLDGAPAGSAAWSGDEYVITTTALAAPAPGTEYRCWIRRGGDRTPIGVMRFTAGTAYWWGRVQVERGYWRLGGQLGVSIETVGAHGDSAPILLGRLGG